MAAVTTSLKTYSPMVMLGARPWLLASTIPATAPGPKGERKIKKTAMGPDLVRAPQRSGRLIGYRDSEVRNKKTFAAASPASTQPTAM